ncbi:winged helix DNA-binding domain-containing protein [Phytohabitans houttuyneae]|uniref:Winged helix DNA-binding domain-containing protein n=1 Tax=Phytohabitans houttuyneae TaxID=1076126 RepID=A0A6V8KF28_9ACTN|nr:winged helix DNA-binding domain-containing protein [Phytohabitans houttuyneae]GFJ81071.1 hypothetical protein Phou_052510 [Phytohabitans houttuyneae]
MPHARVISARELTRAYLDRQLLLRRLPLGPVQALRKLVAAQAQYSPSPYLALAARLEGFAIADLEACLDRGSVVKSSLMRGTLHLAAASEFPAIATVVRVDSAKQWERNWGHPDVDTATLARGLADYLAAPRTADEIRAHGESLTGGLLPARALLQFAKLVLPTVHIAPSGRWREHGAPGLVMWPHPLPPVSEVAGPLIRRYLAGYGPATRADVGAFTRLSMAQVDAGLATLPRLLRLTDEDGRDLLDLPGAPRPRDGGTPAPPRLLPKWDSALLSHADRRRILPDALRTRVINPANGDVLPTYLLDGVVAGTWQIERAGQGVVLRLRPLRPGRDHSDALLEQEARRVARFMEPAATHIDVELDGDARG